MTEDTVDKIFEYISASFMVIIGVVSVAFLLVIVWAAVEGFLGISLMAKIIWILVLAVFVKAVKFVQRIINEKDLI
jgi:glucan phosphoethanolaminetransferase (alkaline phosphatase superfamily)